MPATTTTASAAATSGATAITRWTPATPTSSTRRAVTPQARRVAQTSAATGPSDVPAVSTTTSPAAVGGVPTTAHRASRSISASGQCAEIAAAVAASTRVAQAKAASSRSAARQATVCSGVLPAA
jgi:hypothetical protein